MSLRQAFVNPQLQTLAEKELHFKKQMVFTILSCVCVSYYSAICVICAIIQFSMLSCPEIILILTNVLVNCDTVTKDITVSICSFMPETPEPTRKPHTPVPTTPKPTTSMPDIGTEDDGNTEIENPTTEKPTTSKPTTAAPTTEDDSTTEEEKDENEVEKKGVKEEGEMLISNKNRFLIEFGNYPPQQDDANITAFAKTALNDTCNQAGLNCKLDSTDIEVNYKYEDGSTNVTYEIIFSNIEFDDTLKNNNTWAKIVEGLEGSNSTFYDLMNKYTDDNYTVCKVPDRLKEPTPCNYDKSYYEYLAKSDAEDAIVKPNTNEVDVEYSISCTKNYVTPNNTKGELKVKINEKQSTSYCNIKCSAVGYRDNYNQLSFVVKDNKPSFSKVGTVLPVYQNSKENFTVIMKVAYPESADKKTNTMTISTQGECTLKGNAEVESTTTSFEFKNLYFECPYTNTFSEKIIFTIDGVIKDYSILVVEKPVFVPNVTPTPGEEPVKPEYKCTPPKTLDDFTNLCCDRNETLGESCNSLKITFPFASTKTGGNNNLDDAFVTEYVKMLKKYAFDESNFNFNVTNSGNNMNIEIDVKFYSQKTFIYNAGELERRVLQIGMNWDLLPTPYLYIQTVVSYIEPSAVSDGDSTDEIKSEIPAVLVQAMSENSDTIIGTIQKVKTDATVEAKQISATYDVSLDSEKGITVVAAVVKDATTPTVTNGKLVVTKKEDDSNWAKDNWWVILIICLVVVILIVVIGVVLYIKLSNKSGISSPSSSKSISASKKDIEKSQKIMETVIPIEKIKQDNGVTDEDIYQPFSYEVIMEGYLMKAGHDRVVGKWQRRYCVLYYDPAILRIYDSMVPSLYGKVYLEEKQSIPLDCYDGIEYKEGSNEFTLIIKVRESNLKTFEPGDNERKIQMKVEGENKVETAKRWVECFRDFKNQKPKPAEAWTRPLIMDESNNGKITTTTSKAAEKKNEQIINMFNERRQQAREANQENNV